jgi:hypothetical protein
MRVKQQLIKKLRSPSFCRLTLYLHTVPYDANSKAFSQSPATSIKKNITGSVAVKISRFFP